MTLSDFGEWVDDTYGSIDPIVLEILRQDFRKPIVFGVGPEVRIKPVQLVRRTSTNSLAHDRFVGVENRKLNEKFLGLTQRVGPFENNCGHELYGLQRQRTPTIA